MASLIALAGGAVINALAFSDSNFLFHKMSSSDVERQRHDLAIESFQRDHNSWIERRQEEVDAEQKRRRAAQRSESHLQELDTSMRKYAKVWEVRNPEPKFSQYYHPSEDQKKKDYIGGLVSVVAIGGVAWYVLCSSRSYRWSRVVCFVSRQQGLQKILLSKFPKRTSSILSARLTKSSTISSIPT